MNRLRGFFARFLALFQRSRLDRELAEELESHLAMHVEDNLKAGLDPAEARRQAQLRLGGVAQVEEAVRDRRGLPLVENLTRDLAFGVRTLRRAPGFTAVAVVTLGLGIGANTAIFSVVNAVLLRPLPFPAADRLMMVWATNVERGELEDVASYPDFEAWRDGATSFEHLVAFTTRSLTIEGEDRTELVAGVQATPGLFEAIGATPALGRTFRPDEAGPGAPRVVVLSDAAWRLYFGGRADVLGATLRANQQTLEVVGVMPPGFRFNLAAPMPEQIYTPLPPDPSRNHGFLRVFGRLRPGVDAARAQAELDTLTAWLAREFPTTNEGVGARVTPLADALTGRVRTGLVIFLGIVALVLLVACTNVANLMLARSAARHREMALRAALGASRPRLLQQLVVETTALTVAGGLLGLLFASGTAGLLARLLGGSVPIPRIEATGTDGWVLGFTLLLSVLTGLLFGAVFAPLAVPGDLHGSLGETGRAATGGRSRGRLRGVLVVAQMALALVLLAGAGILLKRLWELRTTAPGFDSENVVAAGLSLPPAKFTHPAQRWAFFQELQARAAAMPGVRSAGLVANLPMTGGSDALLFHLPGRPDPSADEGFRADFNLAGPGYFETMRIPVRAGRTFTTTDSADAAGVIVVNETAARTFWPGESPLERTIRLPTDGGKEALLTVVGVVGDVRQSSLGSLPRPEIFLSFLQPGPEWSGLVLVARAEGEPATLLGEIKSLVRSVDRQVPVAQVSTLDAILSASLAEPRVYSLLLAGFAALALTLATIGLYGVASYTVAQRTPELGIRLVLGAERADVARLVLRQGLALALGGTVIGLAATLALSRLLTRLAPGARPNDPLALAAVSVLLIAVALAATYLPARRAARVDPTVALRYE